MKYFSPTLLLATALTLPAVNVHAAPAKKVAKPAGKVTKPAGIGTSATYDAGAGNNNNGGNNNATPVGPTVTQTPKGP